MGEIALGDIDAYGHCMALDSDIVHALPVTTQGESVSARSTAATPSADAPSSGRPPRARKPERSPVADLVSALTDLRDLGKTTRFALPLPSAERATTVAAAMVDQLDDYLLPRLDRLDAPLLVVVGGSTGAGKSTLVNSLVRDPGQPGRRAAPDHPRAGPGLPPDRHVLVHPGQRPARR